MSLDTWLPPTDSTAVFHRAGGEDQQAGRARADLDQRHAESFLSGESTASAGGARREDEVGDVQSGALDST
ncbi:MAG: hypothetical protein U0802_22460 [Candidatus Binatia bacterium]